MSFGERQLAADGVQRLQQQGAEQLLWGIDGRPMSEYIFVKRGESDANTSSVIRRIARNGWS
jgi:hypothetical protein